jgi:hypothetical protein
MPETPLPGTGNKSIGDICRQYGLNVDKIIQALTEADISVREEMTMKEVARNNNTSPHDVYMLIRSASLVDSEE